MAERRQIVVVGGGLAGSRVAAELHLLEVDADVVLVGAEEHAPYDRPPLSKEVLLADEPPDTALDHDLGATRLLTGRRATGLTATAVLTDDGEVPFDDVVIATGADPVRLPGPGRQAVLRTREDALDLRERLRPEARVVVIGASWIGAEVATAARARGCRTTCVELGAAPLHMALGTELGLRTLSWWDGIDLRLATAVAEVTDDALLLADGEVVPADLVVTGVGVRPATGWLAGSGVPVDRGVLVDAGLRAEVEVGHPLHGRVWAVGDVAARWSPRWGTRLRAEHWDDAVHGPTTVGAGLAGQVVEHDPLPYFWSDQLGHRLQYLGHHDDADRVVLREGGSDDGWSACWLDAGDVLRAVLAADRPRDLVQARKACGRRVDAALLADLSVALRDAVLP